MRFLLYVFITTLMLGCDPQKPEKVAVPENNVASQASKSADSGSNDVSNSDNVDDSIPPLWIKLSWLGQNLRF